MNTNFKYSQKLFFLLLMGFSLCAFQACSDDDEMTDPSQNTTDIAMTGSVNECGYRHANVSGYINLDSLPEGGNNLEVGIEIQSENSKPNHFEKKIAGSWSGKIDRETANSLRNKKFTVTFNGLDFATKYKYRLYVEYGGHTFWGNYNTLTTKDLISSDAVDLGLSVKWASCNVGASSPEDYGSYYAWGENNEKSDYSWNTYKWYDDSNDSMSKYCTNSNSNTTDGKTVLDIEDDVAHIKLGDNWRIPTLEEMKELFEKCKWEWFTYRGIKGQLVTGPNGECIFLPAAGYRGDTDFYNRGTYGNYWLATLVEETDNYACGFYFTIGDSRWLNSSFRYYGYTVRPVTE
ncbi:MAG: hypothetical protein IJA00_07385 [Bacteroidaceae bacterium]|nr:hypothetical protein [Bacteroidaceae bacterium]